MPANQSIRIQAKQLTLWTFAVKYRKAMKASEGDGFREAVAMWYRINKKN